MPKLIKLYIIHSLIGFGIAGVFTAMLLYFNVQNLWYLVTHDSAGWLAVLFLWFMNGIVFAGVQFAYAVMMLGRDEPDDTPRGGLREYARVPVRQESRK
jgi:hypothetical protein